MPRPAQRFEEFTPSEPSSDDRLSVWQGPDGPDGNGVIGSWYYHRSTADGRLVTAHRPGEPDEHGDGGGGPYVSFDAAADAAVSANPDLPRPQQT